MCMRNLLIKEFFPFRNKIWCQQPPSTNLDYAAWSILWLQNQLQLFIVPETTGKVPRYDIVPPFCKKISARNYLSKRFLWSLNSTQCDQNQPCRQSNWKSLQERDGSLGLHCYHLAASVRDRAWGKMAHLDMCHKRRASHYTPAQTTLSSYDKKGVGRLPSVHFSGFSSPFLVSDFSLSDAGLCANED